MPRVFTGPNGLAVSLLLLTAIPIAVSAVRLVQIPSGSLPDDALRLTAVLWAHFLHALGGVLFGILGPIQFSGVLQRRFGATHRITGRVFVLAGALLSLASFRLLFTLPDAATALLDTARLLAGLGLALALVLAMRAIFRQDVPSHKAWMIRAYAIGMGSGTVALIMAPIFIATGEPVNGLASDTVFVGSWVGNLLIAEWVIRRPKIRMKIAGVP